MYSFLEFLKNHPSADDFFNKYDKALYYEIFQKGEYSFLENEIRNSKIIFDICNKLKKKGG